MSITYTPTTNFGSKDSLPSNDPNKVIKGAEFTTEFTAIQSAFGLAAPSSNPTFTGTATFDSVTANTVSLGNVTTSNLTVNGAFTSVGIDDNATSTAITIDASQNVGVGTNAPNIMGWGNALTVDSSTQPAVELAQAGVATGYFASQTDGRLRLGNQVSGQPIQFLTADVGVAAVIDGAGNVGIGTSNPTTSLDIVRAGVEPLRIQSTTSDTVQVRLANTAGNAFINGVGNDIVIPSGNVGIGTTSPLGPLDVKAATDIHVGIADSGSDALIYASTDAGQTAVVPLKFQGNSFKFNGSSEFMRIDSSGNVGIGYSSPTAKLHVLEDGSPCALTVQALGASNTATLNLLGRDSSNVSVAYKIQTVADGALSFSKDSNERLRISASGTTTVTGGFLAAQPSAGSGAFAAGTDAGAISQSASAVAVGNAAGYTGQGANTVAVGLLAGRTNQGQDSVAIGKYSGNNTQGGQAVAIGVSAGQTTQQGSAVAVGRQAGETDQGFASVATGYQAGQLRQGGYGVAVGHAAGLSDQGARSVAVGLSAGQVSQGASSVAIGHLAGKTNQGANGIIISSSGAEVSNNFVGHIVLQSGSNKYLYYNGTDTWKFRGGDVKVPADDLVVGTSSTVGNGASTAGVQLTTNPAGVGQIRLGKTLSGTYSMLANYHNGVFVGGLNVSNTATTIVASSDERLKKNIVDAPAGNIEDIKVRSFDWKSTDEHQEYGVIAQELNEVAPYAVHHNEEEDHWGVDYAALVPMLVKEIQDLKAEVEALKNA
jgi:hypothetical protein